MLKQNYKGEKLIYTIIIYGLSIFALHQLQDAELIDTKKEEPTE